MARTLPGRGTYPHQAYQERLHRSIAYLSMLSGAKGFTYGNGSIWSWGNDVSWDGASWSFTEGLNQPSATQMQYMFDLFSGLRWYDLAPQHQLVKNQSTDPLKKMVLAKTSDSKLAVAYLQDNASIAIQMGSFPTPMAAQWFNPLTDTRHRAVESPSPMWEHKRSISLQVQGGRMRF